MRLQIEIDEQRLARFCRRNQIRRQLSEVLGRTVDLHTPASLSHFFRERVVASAEVAYAA